MRVVPMYRAMLLRGIDKPQRVAIVCGMATGTELKQAREDAELTQEQVADRLGVSRVTVTLWEGKAEVKTPKAKRFLAAVEALRSEKAA
jgi:DNA-binding transcriptional regulator YiaG